MKWVLAGSDEGTIAALAEQAGLHPLIARLMSFGALPRPR
jgi:hypothetical protein